MKPELLVTSVLLWNANKRDDQVIKKVKKAFETSDHSFSELDFPNHSDQKITLNLEFFNKICMTAGAHVEKLDDNKLG